MTKIYCCIIFIFSFYVNNAIAYCTPLSPIGFTVNLPSAVNTYPTPSSWAGTASTQTVNFSCDADSTGNMVIILDEGASGSNTYTFDDAIYSQWLTGSSAGNGLYGAAEINATDSASGKTITIKTGQSIDMGISCNGGCNRTIVFSNAKISLYTPTQIPGAAIPLGSIGYLSIKAGYDNESVGIIMAGGNTYHPVSCTLNNNSSSNINFGNLASGDFGAAGATLDNAKKTITVNVQCSDTTGNLQATVSATPSVLANAVSTSNSAVGVIVKSSSGAIVSPSGGTMPITMSGTTGSLVFSVTPVSTNGKAPTAGAFTSVMTILVDVP